MLCFLRDGGISADREGGRFPDWVIIMRRLPVSGTLSGWSSATTWTGRLGLLIVLLVPGCDDGPTRPSPLNLAGSWTGTSTYPNAPFSLVLTQTGGVLGGEYRDGLDRSLAVNGTYTPPAFTLVVDFGDAKLNLTGTVTSARAAEGTMSTSALGNRPYPFQMTR